MFGPDIYELEAFVDNERAVRAKRDGESMMFVIMKIETPLAR